MIQTEKAQADGGIRKACLEAVFLSRLLRPTATHFVFIAALPQVQWRFIDNQSEI
jgi:hypothetical protein